jgi:hypothetical protein
MEIKESSGDISSEMESPKPAPKPEKTSPSRFEALITKIGVWLLFLLIGALAVTLALYLPTLTRLNKAQAEVERLTEIESEYNELLPQFGQAKTQSVLYKTISDTILLQTAFTENDSTKKAQQLRYVEDDLTALYIAGYPEILQRLQSQFNKIKSASTTTAALSELDEFYKDLLLLADNLR